jgi:hypothetical protein
MHKSNVGTFKFTGLDLFNLKDSEAFSIASVDNETTFLIT